MLQLAGSAATLSTAGLSNIMRMLLFYLNRYFQLLIRFLNLQLDYRVKKIEYIKDLSARIIDGRVNLSVLPGMTDEEIVAQLRLECGQQKCF